ncbi:Cyclin, N-terminal domain containing protein [Trichomonas vaginalis G3]|uniref:Cyclin, N-terminal domain containing protein n=1 Tax=Trichomonas vaginalis (strain ATCC PRA-98 / G3) TaxID=412133 RepID=A2E0Q4_TRIV3|nr:Cyclin, N-terminal domain containing protein [Trichomonas vaginalis G3]|eukprot:XP_001326022.1 Cyclin, N-terminal domain containing protein [Trichomonas vaginalis G3]
MSQSSAIGQIHPARASRKSSNAGVLLRVNGLNHQTSTRVPLGEVKPTIYSILGSKPTITSTKAPSVSNDIRSSSSSKNLADHTDYENEIYKYLNDIEGSNLPQPSLFEDQSNITPKMRATLIDWLVEVHNKLNMQQDTLYYTVSYIDRYLMERDLDKSKFQLLGTAAILIAAKTEEIYPPHCEKLVHYAGDSFTVIGLQRMESSLLNVLEFSTNPVVTSQFLRRFISIANADSMMNSFANYISELILLDSEFLGILPSKLTAAIIFYAMQITHNASSLNQDFEKKIGYSMKDISQIMNMIHKSIQNAAASRFQAIRKKYATAQREFVSTIEIPKEMLF